MFHFHLLPTIISTIVVSTLLLQESYAYTFTNIKSQSSLLLQVVTRNQHDITTSTSTSTNINTNINQKRYNNNNNIQMRDLSSANVFQKGDQVKVISSVLKSGIDLNGRIGIVKATWEKCDVDPTCCCAEFVDENFAVTVQFDRPLDNSLDDVGGSSSDTSSDSDSDNGSSDDKDEYFTHFFAEAELIQVKQEEVDTPPFDGMSCKAFKLDQLKMGKQAQRIALYESSVSSSSSSSSSDNEDDSTR